MNRYRTVFAATCPANGQTVSYKLEIEAPFVIMAEAITSACFDAAGCEKPYHENIADLLHAKLGGRQTMVAHHHGVEIETVRG